VYIRRTSKTVKGRTYYNYLLVASVKTPAGPRQRTLCSLGALSADSASQQERLVERIGDLMGGQAHLLAESDDPLAAALVRRIKARFGPGSPDGAPEPRQSPKWAEVLGICPEGIRSEQLREAGPLHVANCFWHRLGLSEVLREAGLNPAAVQLTQAMVANRLIQPKSELAMVKWFGRVALEDVLEISPDILNDDRLYRHLDCLHPRREAIETALAAREERLFNLERSIFLYDLTSTYFEGLAQANPKARRGYSRDHRPDCKQVVIGMALRREGFPLGHEVFAGNQHDGPSLPLMIESLRRRFALRAGDTIVIDRGMADAISLATIRQAGLHYIVATRQNERQRFLADFEQFEAFTEIIREPSPTNPGQHKSMVRVRRLERDGELYVLCLSEGRQAKDRAIREKAQTRMLADLEKLQRSATAGRLTPEAMHERIGRLRERYPRVARYMQIEVDHNHSRIQFAIDLQRQTVAEQLDGAYLLRSDRIDLGAEEAWRVYILLTRVEQAFRDLKSPLAERPIFHHLEHRVEAHIFLSVLAYHIQVAVENTLREQGDHRSWAAIREILGTHQTLTTVLPTRNGKELHIRNASVPEATHRAIYRALGIPELIIRPRRAWVEAARESSDEKPVASAQNVEFLRKLG